MERKENIESDYRKWLVFSNAIKSSSTTNELEKAVKSRKSTKNISITTEGSSTHEKMFLIKEVNNPSVLKIDESSVHELKDYIVENYKLTKSENSKLKINRNGNSKPTPPKYLYSESKLTHGLIYSLFTLILLQILILPKLLLDVDYGIIGNFLRYPISLVGLFFCFKYYKRHYEYHLHFSDVFLIIWSFNTFLFFFYLSELTLLSIPDQIPNVTWTSFVFIGTLILGQVYLLIASFILATVFYLIKKIV
ncbi:hypothetical protein [Ekhidna sp.]